MRWIGLAVLIMSIPIFAALIGRGNAKRDLAIMLLGLLVFVTGKWSHSVALYVWPVWQGSTKGVFLSLVDTLAIALLITRPPGKYRIPFLPLILLYILTVVVSIVPAYNKVAAVFTVAQLVQMIILYVAVASELHRPTAIRALMLGLSAGLIFQAAYVIRMKLGGMVQAYGTFSHQNLLGMAVELSLLPLIAAVLEGERNKFVYAGIIAGAVCIAGSGSRAAMGFAAIGTVLLILFSLARKSTKRKWQVVGLGVAGAVVMVPLGIATLQDRFGGGAFKTQENARITLGNAARLMANENVLGVGANNFVVVNNTQLYLERAGGKLTQATRRQPTHNAYLLARSETGWAGEITLILLLGGLATAGIVLAFKKRKLPLAGLALGNAAAIGVVALHSNYEYALHQKEIQQFLFLNAAMLAGLMYQASRGARKNSLPRRADESRTELMDKPTLAEA